MKECNLPQKVQENVKSVCHINYQQEIVAVNEFGQKCIEFKQTSKPDLQPNTMAAVQR